jgi:hypothetical protein
MFVGGIALLPSGVSRSDSRPDGAIPPSAPSSYFGVDGECLLPQRDQEIFQLLDIVVVGGFCRPVDVGGMEDGGCNHAETGEYVGVSPRGIVEIEAVGGK